MSRFLSGSFRMLIVGCVSVSVCLGLGLCLCIVVWRLLCVYVVLLHVPCLARLVCIGLVIVVVRLRSFYVVLLYVMYCAYLLWLFVITCVVSPPMPICAAREFSSCFPGFFQNNLISILALRFHVSVSVIVCVLFSFGICECLCMVDGLRVHFAVSSGNINVVCCRCICMFVSVHVCVYVFEHVSVVLDRFGHAFMIVLC